MSTTSETKAERDPLTPNQVKGIDMVIKAIGKKYPYIVGWEKSEVFDKYQTQMFIDLIVDMEKLAKYYNSPIKSYWVDDLIEGRYDSIGGAFYLVNYDEIRDDAYAAKRKIESRIQEMYNFLPKDFQVFVKWSGGNFILGDNEEYYKSVSNIDIHTCFVKIFN
jgi:hypothetical protein